MAEEGLKKTKNDLIHIGCPIPFDIEVFLKQLDGLMEAIYDFIASTSVNGKTIDDLNKFDYSHNTNYILQNILMEENAGNFHEMAQKAEELNKVAKLGIFWKNLRSSQCLFQALQHSIHRFAFLYCIWSGRTYRYGLFWIHE